MSELVLNPRLRIRAVAADGPVTAYTISAPVKGRGRVERTLAVDATDPAVIDVLRGLVAADEDLEVSDDACPALIELGVLVEEDAISQPVRFACRLAAHAPARSVLAFDDFVAREPELGRVMAASPYIAIVEDATTGARYPYWLDEPSVAEPAGGHAGVDLAAAAAHFAARGYAVIPQLVPAPQVAAAREYYRGLVDEGYLRSQDGQVELRSVIHDEAVMRYYHRELCRAFARVVAAPIKPSYSYFAAYRRGATLEKHTDREQCKYTASLLLEYDAGAPPWPLHLEIAGEVVTVEQSVGDCVLFCGQVQPHFRHALRGERSTSLLFHYVDEAFTGSLQ